MPARNTEAIDVLMIGHRGASRHGPGTRSSPIAWAPRWGRTSSSPSWWPRRTASSSRGTTTETAAPSSEFRHLGVDGLCSDFPDAAVKALRSGRWCRRGGLARRHPLDSRRGRLCAHGGGVRRITIDAVRWRDDDAFAGQERQLVAQPVVGEGDADATLLQAATITSASRSGCSRPYQASCCQHEQGHESRQQRGARHAVLRSAVSIPVA